MTYRQRRLDGSEYVVSETAPVPLRTDYEGYERWRNQYRDDDGEKQEDVVGIHRLAAIAWCGFGKLGPGVVVHHVNGIPWDNRQENIVLMDRSSHSTLHNNDRYRDD